MTLFLSPCVENGIEVKTRRNKMKKNMSLPFRSKGNPSSRYLIDISILLLCMLAFLVSGCSEVRSPLEEPPKTRVTMAVVSGNNQAGQGGRQLTDPLIVQVTNEGIPLGNVSVYFRVVEGGGSVTGESLQATNNSGLAEAHWQIGSGYNGIEVILQDEDYTAAPCYFCAEGENPTGIFKTRTISSLEKISDKLYCITFYGDYGEILQDQNHRYGGDYDYSPGSSTAAGEKKDYCSLFTAFANPNYHLFGRSFDNPSGWNCLTLLGRFHPPDGYASLALSRMKDYGFNPGVDFDMVPFTEKEQLLEAAFFPPDGINEHGVVIGLANVRELTFTPDPDKKSIYVTLWVREVLDHARNIDEAIAITLSYNIIYRNSASNGVHALVADASGRSAILELFGDDMRVIPNPEPWQVLTNSPTYNIPIPERKAECWRYRTIYDFLETAGGNITRQDGLDLLGIVGNTYTEWSAIYDMTNRKIILAIDFHFDHLYRFSFQE